MAIVVEHDKRKHEILQKSIDVFIDEGYEDATFQKIADRCGITRTTLYIYFKNKHEIFLGSIKELTASLERSLNQILDDKTLNAEQTLRGIVARIIDECEKNQKLFYVLLNYLMQLNKSGADTDKLVKRRIIRIRHLLTTIMIRGINSGEFKKQDLHQMNDLLYGLIESCMFRLAVLSIKGIEDTRNSLSLAIDGFLV